MSCTIIAHNVWCRCFSVTIFAVRYNYVCFWFVCFWFADKPSAHDLEACTLHTDASKVRVLACHKDALHIEDSKKINERGPDLVVEISLPGRGVESPLWDDCVEPDVLVHDLGDAEIDDAAEKPKLKPFSWELALFLPGQALTFAWAVMLNGRKVSK